MCWSKPSRRRAKPISSKKLNASIFSVGWRLTRPETASAETSITSMATVTAAIITETSFTMPTAVITESSEKTMSSRTIWTKTLAKVALTQERKQRRGESDDPAQREEQEDSHEKCHA